MWSMAAVRFANRLGALVRDIRARIASRYGPEVVDGTMAFALAVAMLGDRFGAAAAIGDRMPLAVVCSLVIAGALVLRRRRPLTAYLVGSAGLVVESLFVRVSPVTPFANLIAIYSVAFHATRARAWLALAGMPLGVVAYFAGLGVTSVAQPVSVFFTWIFAWTLGYAGARRQEERDAAAGLARSKVVAEERTRIARELHDLVGHTLNVMLVQAGAARRVLDRDPAKTRELLTGVEHTGREALDELDRVLGLLRHDGPPAVGAEPGELAGQAPVPTPGLADLPRLAGRIGQTGIRLALHLDPGVEQVPRTVNVSAYRIIQEALTNTVKHGRASSAQVAVRRNETVLDIEVTDDGRGPEDGYVPGRGLLGIAERVCMFGGRVEHGGGEGGGFRVHAVLTIP